MCQRGTQHSRWPSGGSYKSASGGSRSVAECASQPVAARRPVAWRAQFRYMVWLRGLPSRLRRLRLVLSCRCTSRKCLEAPVLVFVCLHVVRKNMVFIQLHRTFMVKMGERGKGSRLVKVFAFRLPPIVCYTRPHSRISLHEVPAHSFVTTACSLASNALDIIFTLP